MARRGRPSNADLELRKRRRKQWEFEQKQRRWMESQIAQGRAEVVSPKEYVERMDRKPNDPLDNVLIGHPTPSPAMEFLFDKVRGALTEEQYDAAMWQAMIDLLMSGVALDDKVRRRIAVEMRKRSDAEFAEQCRQGRDQAKFAVVTWALAEGARRGWTDNETFEELAKRYGHASAESLRKWLANHKPTD